MISGRDVVRRGARSHDATALSHDGSPMSHGRGQLILSSSEE